MAGIATFAALIVGVVSYEKLETTQHLDLSSREGQELLKRGVGATEGTMTTTGKENITQEGGNVYRLHYDPGNHHLNFGAFSYQGITSDDIQKQYSIADSQTQSKIGGEIQQSLGLKGQLNSQNAGQNIMRYFLTPHVPLTKKQEISHELHIPELADQKQIIELAKALEEARQKAKAKNLKLTLEEELAALDGFDQYGPGDPSKGIPPTIDSFLDHLKEARDKNEKDPILTARIAMHTVNGRRVTNVDAVADSSRRHEAMSTALQNWRKNH